MDREEREKKIMGYWSGTGKKREKETNKDSVCVCVCVKERGTEIKREIERGRKMVIIMMKMCEFFFHFNPST